MPVTDALRFITRPRFTEGRARVDAEGLRHLLVLFLLTVLAVVVATGFVWPIILSATGGEMPSNANDALINMNPARMVLIGMVVAPLVEELIFRSWLGAPRACLYGLPLLAGALVVTTAAGSGASGALVLPLAAVAGFLGVAVWARARALGPGAVSHARAALFAWAFWGSAGLFALIHLANFTDGIQTPWLVLAVVPQLMVGLVLGYVRMRFGLAPAIGFHGAYNALFLTLALLGSGLSGGAGDAAAALGALF